VLLFEAFRGGDLSFHLFLHGPFSMPTARAYFLQVGGALAHVHRHGRVHRDLKPWNIVLSDDFTATKLIDFGLSTPIVNKVELCPGTRQYMAPELFKEGSAIDKVDTFAMGVLLLNLVTGTYAFDSCLDQSYAELISNPERFLKGLNQEHVEEL
jgi:serine/threonine protein kinase